jgi:hypothetical protein
MHENKDLLVIICDPKTDNIYVSYKDAMAAGKIKSPTGKKLHVIKGVLRESLFKDNIDMFITGMVETLKIPLRKGNQFMMFLDGAVYSIAKTIQQRKKRSSANAAGKRVKSPFVNSSRAKE